MSIEADDARLEEIKKDYPEKFVPEDRIFRHIHPGDRILSAQAAANRSIL